MTAPLAERRRDQRSVRHVLTATLILESPLHVGGVQALADAAEPTTDAEGRTLYPLTLARTGHAEPYLPGSALAGVLRHWHGRHHTTADTDAVFGSSDRGSLLDVDHAVFTVVPDGTMHRPSVGINRRTGAAAHGALFMREILPAGSTALIRVTARTNPDDSDAPALRALWQIRQALERGSIRFGAASTRGLGKLFAVDAQIRTYDLAHFSGLRAWLTDPAGRPDDQPPAKLSTPQDARLILSIDWSPLRAVLVAFQAQPTTQTPGEDTKVETTVPLVEPAPRSAGSNADYVPVLPGAGIKGALRTRAGRIARTVLARDAETSGTLSDYLDNEPNLVTLLFGSTRQRGALTVPDVYARSGISRTDARQLRKVPMGKRGSDEWNRTRGNVTEAVLDAFGQPATHVAIDRWTGSAADGRLFRVLPPQRVTGWEPVRLELDWERLGRAGDDVRKAALCLLGLVLAELAAGTLPLGSRTTRGLGALTVHRINVEPEGALGSPWTPATLAGAELPGQILDLVRAQQPKDGWATHLTSEDRAPEPTR